MVDRIVFHVDFADAQPPRQPLCTHERREARVQARARLPLDRQELPVSPQVLGAALDELTGDHAANGVVVVRDFERPETAIANPERSGWKGRVAEMTAQRKGHGWCAFNVLIVHATPS